MSLFASRATSGKALRIYLVILAALVIVGIALTVYQYELGLASPGPGAARAFYTLVEVDATLGADPDYAEFSQTLRAAHVAVARMPVSNTADNRVLHSAQRALECYDTLREAWQTDLEGQWRPETDGDPECWRRFHPGIELAGQATMTAQQIIDACALEARTHIDDALVLVAE